MNRVARLQGVLAPLVLLFAITVTAQDHKAGHWGYDGGQGPSHWADMNPEFTLCRSGHQQSPIDIRHPQKADLPPIQVDYKPAPLHIIDNGHTIMVNYTPGSFISVGGKQYALKQFHFHRPSEERINGKAYEMSCTLCMPTSKAIWQSWQCCFNAVPTTH